MSDLCAHGQSLLIWVFFKDPQGELTRNAYDDDDDDETSLRLHGVDLSSNMDANGDTFPLLPSCEKVAHSHQ